MTDHPNPPRWILASTPVGDRAVLRSLGPDDASALYRTVAEHRAELDPWLRWTGPIRSLDAARAFVAGFRAKMEQGDGFHLGLWHAEELQGGVVCWRVDPVHRNAEVGYWLVPGARGRGLATAATGLVVDRLFREDALNRVELQCAVHNRRSRRLAERLGFRFEGIRRQSHRIGDRFVDHALYAALAGEWTPPGPGR